MPPSRRRNLRGPLAQRTLLALALIAPGHAVDYIVSTDADEAYDGGSLMAETIDGSGLSLREAIGLANGSEGDDDGDTIAFDPLVFLLGPPVVNITAPLEITDDVRLDGEVALDALTGPATVDGGDATRLILLNTGSAPGAERAVSLANLVLTNGSAVDGGGAIRLGAVDQLALDAVTVSSSSAPDGGGIYNDGGSLTASGTDFTDNVADGASGSGGAIFNAGGGSVVLDGGTFSGNLANRAGGAIEDQSGGSEGFDLELSGVTFTANNAGLPPTTAAPGNGGAIHITGSGSIRIEGGSATGNLAAREGGAFWNGTGTMELVDAKIGSNTASGPGADDGGGGVFNNGGTLTIRGGSISGNVADGASGSGGGILTLDGAVTLTDMILASNVANRAGGGIEAIDGVLSLSGVTLGGTDPAAGNIAGPGGSAAPGNGGALHISGTAATTLSGGRVGFNVAASEGGGLWNQSGATMIVRGGAMIADNIAQGTAADNGGGGVFNNGGILDINATDGAVQVLRNQAINGSGSGGGLLNTPGGKVTISGATFTGNLANRAGGAIEDVSGLADGLTLTDTTLSDNGAGTAPATASPGNGGGIHITGSGGASITRGLIRGNSAAAEGGGLWNGTGTMAVAGTEIRDNAASGAASDNGGGGIFNNGGTLVISAMSVIDGNIADGTAGSGGGIFNELGGTLSIENSTLSNNRANRAGGGIEDNSGAGLGVTLVEVTMSGNNAGIAPAVAAPGNGGALHVTGPGDVAITGGSVSGNSAALEGGGLWNGAGTMTVDATELASNLAAGDALDDGGGGIFNNGGTLVVRNGALLSGNSATGTSGSGGGILNVGGGTIAVSDSSFSANLANRAGGGIEDQSGLTGTAVTLDRVDFSGNQAGTAPATANPGNGGALHVSGPGGVRYTGGSVTANEAAAEGGGLWNGTGTMTVDGVRFEGNVASGDAADHGGGALFNAGGTLSVTGSTLLANLADGASGSGGGILNDASGTLMVDDSTLRDNLANRAGGALEATAGTISTLDGCIVSGNTAGPEGTAAPGNGGAVHISGDGSVSTTGTAYDGNVAGNEGGGLWNSGSGTLTITDCSVTGGFAPDGGGLFNQAGSGMTMVTNTTISGNSATHGGGIRIEGGTIDLLHVTIAANRATGVGGGVEVVSGMLGLSNSAVADNAAPAGPDASGAFASASFSLLEDGTDASGIADGTDGNRVGVDPMLVALADNGGPTPSHRPLSGSPLVDAGSNAAAAGLDFDQRGSGRPRILGPGVDIGAIEVLVTGYAEWAEANFTDATPVAGRDPGDDPDGDRLDNAGEWLTGSNPEVGDASPFEVMTDGGTTTIRFPRSKSVPQGAEVLETSTNLAGWTPRPTADVERENLGADLEQVRLTVPTDGEPRLFLRLEVTTP